MKNSPHQFKQSYTHVQLCSTSFRLKDTKIRLLTLNRQIYSQRSEEPPRLPWPQVSGEVVIIHLSEGVPLLSREEFRPLLQLYYFINHTLLLSPTFSPPILSQLSRVAVFSSQTFRARDIPRSWFWHDPKHGMYSP